MWIIALEGCVGLSRALDDFLRGSALFAPAFANGTIPPFVTSMVAVLVVYTAVSWLLPLFADWRIRRKKEQYFTILQKCRQDIQADRINRSPEGFPITADEYLSYLSALRAFRRIERNRGRAEQKKGGGR